MQSKSKNGIRSSAANAIASRRACRRLILRPLHQLRQFRHVDRYPAGFVAREKIGSGASARLILIIDVTERSPVGIADDETRAVIIDRPRRREMAGVSA